MVIHNLTDKISYETLNSIKVTYTSSKNAIGILGAFWLDGDVLDFELERDSSQEIWLRETETIYLKEKSNCSSDSFYDCFLPKFLEKDFATCPKKCLPFHMNGLLNTTIPSSEINSEEYNCAKVYMQSYISNVSIANLCPRSCKINEYTGKITYSAK